MGGMIAAGLRRDTSSGTDTPGLLGAAHGATDARLTSENYDFRGVPVSEAIIGPGSVWNKRDFPANPTFGCLHEKRVAMT